MLSADIALWLNSAHGVNFIHRMTHDWFAIREEAAPVCIKKTKKKIHLSQYT